MYVWCTLVMHIFCDVLLQVSCRLLHIRSGVEVGEVCDQLEKHFKTIGAPVMIGELPLLLNGFEVKL